MKKAIIFLLLGCLLFCCACSPTPNQEEPPSTQDPVDGEPEEDIDYFDFWGYYDLQDTHFVKFRSTGFSKEIRINGPYYLLQGVIAEDLCGNIESGTVCYIPIRSEVYIGGNPVLIPDDGMETYLNQTDTWIAYITPYINSDGSIQFNSDGSIRSISPFFLASIPELIPVIDNKICFESDYDLLKSYDIEPDSIAYKTIMDTYAPSLYEGMSYEQAIENLKEYVKRRKSVYENNQ